MPYYYQYKESEQKNLQNLSAYLEKEDVAYVDLYRVFTEAEAVLYHRTDSHWTNQGAALANMLYPADTIIVERAECFLSDMGKILRSCREYCVRHFRQQ